MDILNIIRENKLMYLNSAQLVKQIALVTNSNILEIKNQVNRLIQDGTLFLAEDNKVSISADKGYLKAIMTINKKGYGFAKVDGQDDIFIPAFEINGAFDGDDCLVEITNKKSDTEIEGRVVKVLKHNTTHIVGTFIQGKSKDVVFSDDEKYPQIRIYKGDSKNAKNNDKVWVELDMSSLETSTLRGKIIEVLGQANTPKAEQLSIIRSFNLIDQFSEKVKNCVKAINQNVDAKNFKKRANYLEHKVITIDGEDARDFDDALSIQKTKNGYTLFVHIADVSNYVVEDSALDKEAYQRGTSVYFPNMVIPMLPKKISNGVCSLSEGVNRLVLTVEIELDKKFNVLGSSIKEGIINSSHRMTYTEVQNILSGDELLIEKYRDVYDDIMLYQAISNKLKQDRRNRGEIRMNIPEPFILENSNGEIVSIEKRLQDESHQIIESLMILTNECVASTFFKLALPFVYRVHEKPDEERVERLSQILTNMGVSNNLELDGDKPESYQKIMDKIKDSPKERALTMMVLRSMTKAKYAPTCLGHFALASEFYCHFTSPIRRYPDLLIHRIIKEYIHSVPKQDIKLQFESVVERASEQSSKTEKIAEQAEREVDDYKKAVYMTKFLGEEFDGIVSGVQEFGIFVELDNGIEGLVRVNSLPMDQYVFDDLSLTLTGKQHKYSIGDSVRIVVANTNTHLRQIDFDLAGVNLLSNNVVTSNRNLKRQNKNTKSKKNKKR